MPGFIGIQEIVVLVVVFFLIFGARRLSGAWRLRGAVGGGQLRLVARLAGTE